MIEDAMDVLLQLMCLLANRSGRSRRGRYLRRARSRRMVAAHMIRPGFWKTLTAIALGVYLGLWLTGGDRSLDAAGARIRPDAAQTPGVTRTLTRQQVCGTKWGKDRRAVTLTMRRHVFAAYSIPYEQHAKYEVDHLIPRELGGADDERNLWPQKWDGVDGAHAKDRLENRLHRAVCAGELTLDSAQAIIRSDWIAAYRLWVH